MLAQTAPSPRRAAQVAPAAVEWKLDGARIQVHRDGDDVAVFTRTLDHVSAAARDRRGRARAAGRAVILDGEAIALRPDGRPLPFQVTVSRAASRGDVAALREAVPLTPFFFDALHLDGRDLLDLPARERLAALEPVLPAGASVPRLVTGDPAEAQAFLDDALARGHEGVVVKALDAPYEAGRRGAGWLKVKPVHTLDLVVLAAEWGHGRRQGWLSNLHLGARDPETRGFVMLGKTFKGLTDEMLEWQTARLLELESRRDASTVYVRPSSSSRSPSTACRRARATPAAWRCASPACCATATTSAPTRPTRSRPCARCTPRARLRQRLYPAATSSTPTIVRTEPPSCTRVTRSPRWIRASATVTTGKSELSTAVIESSCSVVETE